MGTGSAAVLLVGKGLEKTGGRMTYEQRLCAQMPHLRRYALALCGDPSGADDLVQDCLERALTRRHLWHPGWGLRPWLLRMLYRLYLNQQASAAQRREVNRDDPAEDAVEPARQESYLECARASDALARLPEEQRAALLLVILEDLNYRQAARVLGVKVGTLRSRLSRARETLRRDNARRQSAGDRRPPLRRVK